MKKSTAAPAPLVSRVTEVIGPFFLSYAVGILALFFLIYQAGVWGILANTRLLDILISGGLIQLHDADAGFIAGIPLVGDYLKSQDPIDLRLIAIVIGLYVLLALVKAYQAHRLITFTGVSGTLGQHSRAYLYGNGLGRFLPFRLGDVATFSALRSQGAPAGQAAQAVYLIGLFTVFEIVVFGAVGLWLVGLGLWLQQLLWAFIILGVSYYLLRPAAGRASRSPALVGWVKSTARMFSELAVRQPGMFTGMAILSVISFLLFELAAYLTVMAFTGDFVILNVEPSIILMGLVAMNIVRLLPFTPGSIGLAEWAFTMALVYAGVGFPEAATVAILVSFFRHLSAAIVTGVVIAAYGLDTNVRTVIDVFRETKHEQEPSVV